MKLNKQQQYSVFLWIGVAIIALVFLTSCGSRRVQKSNTETVTKTEAQTTTVDSSKTIVNTDTNTKVIDCTDTDEITIQPLDNTKEMVVNGKKYFNSVLKHKKTKTNTNINTTQKVAKIEQKAVKIDSKAVSNSSTKVSTKDVDRSGFNWWWLLLLLIPLGFWYYLKKNSYI